MSEKDKLSQVERCMIAIHDLGTRRGATHISVLAALKAEGFDRKTVKAAIKEMGGGQ